MKKESNPQPAFPKPPPPPKPPSSSRSNAVACSDTTLKRETTYNGLFKGVIEFCSTCGASDIEDRHVYCHGCGRKIQRPEATK